MADFIRRPSRNNVWGAFERLNRESPDFEKVKQYIQDLEMKQMNQALWKLQMLSEAEDRYSTIY